MRYIPFPMGHYKAVKPVLVTLTPDVQKTLSGLALDVQDRLGTAIGISTALRALVRLAQPHNEAFLQALTDAVEQELNSGIRWGKSAKKRPAKASSVRQ